MLCLFFAHLGQQWPNNYVFVCVFITHTVPVTNSLSSRCLQVWVPLNSKQLCNLPALQLANCIPTADTHVYWKVHLISCQRSLCVHTPLQGKNSSWHCCHTPSNLVLRFCQGNSWLWCCCWIFCFLTSPSYVALGLQKHCLLLLSCLSILDFYSTSLPFFSCNI